MTLLTLLLFFVVCSKPTDPDAGSVRGQMEKILDVLKMKRVLGWKPPTDLRTGLEPTILWYIENKEAADARF